MYNLFIFLHSWNRWCLLILGTWLIFSSLLGWMNKKTFTSFDNRLSASFTGLLHLQLVLGMTLYFFLSPVVDVALNDLGTTMENNHLRYWGIEHITGMVIGIGIAQAGRTISKKADSDDKKFKRQFIYYFLGLTIILITVIFADRPWFRF